MVTLSSCVFDSEPFASTCTVAISSCEFASSATASWTAGLFQCSLTAIPAGSRTPARNPWIKVRNTDGVSSFSEQTSIANKHHVAAINNQQLPTTNSPPFATATDAYFATTSNERVTTVADSELLAIAD